MKVRPRGRFHPFESLTRLWKSSSLRTQLVVMTSGLMLLAVVVTAILTASLFRQEMVRQIDEDLFVNRNNVSVYLTSLGTDTEYFSSPQSILRFYGELMDNEGNKTVNSSFTGAQEDTPVIPELDAAQVEDRSGQAFDVPGTSEDSRGWRVQVYRLESGEGSLAIALPLEPVHTSVERVTSLVATIGLLATAGVSMISYAVVTRALRPLLRVERTAAQIAAGDLSRRVENGPPDTEVGRLSRSLNAMLAHIESAFRAKEQSEQKMRRFIQDASHELRTPLVTIRGFSELYRHGGITDPDDVGEAMGRIESEANRMGGMVEDLLTLARLDEQRPLEHKPLDLLVLANDAVLDARVNAPERTVTLTGLDGGRPGSAPTHGDESRLRQVMVNLVTNALRYTPEGTPIEIAVGTHDVLPGSVDATGRQIEGSRESVIEVRDHGPGIDEDEAARVFERFYRADTSRQRETGGTGLGLAIVAAIVAQHDGSVRLAETPGGGATMSVRMPWDDSAYKDAEGSEDGDPYEPEDGEGDGDWPDDSTDDEGGANEDGLSSSSAGGEGGRRRGPGARHAGGSGARPHSGSGARRPAGGSSARHEGSPTDRSARTATGRRSRRGRVVAAVTRLFPAQGTRAHDASPSERRGRTRRRPSS